MAQARLALARLRPSRLAPRARCGLARHAAVGGAAPAPPRDRARAGADLSRERGAPGRRAARLPGRAELRARLGRGLYCAGSEVSVTARYEVLDPLFDAAQADAMLRLCERFGRYGCYAEDATNSVKLAPDLPQRWDAAWNFVKTGGRFGRKEEPAVLAARTNYFRETYAYDDDALPGIEPFMHHAGLREAAKKVHDCAVVVPNIVYANLLVPGQELAVHTDVPEFRGANRKLYREWRMVLRLHSGLFAGWRRRIATGISYFGTARGGALAFYPDGRDGTPRTLEARHDTAIVLDTDTVFHGVDRVAETQPLLEARPGMQLAWDGAGWRAGPAEAPLARYRWDEVRFSVAWKASCYPDEAERRLVDEHRDDLSLEQILGTLKRDLGARGAEIPSDETELARLLIDTYIRFPAPVAEA